MFDTEGFENASFYPRQKVVSVKALAAFFLDGAEPEFTVRGLTSDELHSSVEAGSRAKTLDNVVRAIGENKEAVNAIREAIGLKEDTPAEVRKRIEMLVAGCVKPVFSHRTAAKLAENFPIEFMLLTNEITELTGLGASLEKPSADSP
jgi:hypothetical protein